jgi:hypothetical protein
MSSTEQKPTDESATAPIFVVTAYRHGELGNHSYVAYVGTNRQVAITAAKDENEGRGLKYGVEVVEYPSEEPVAYFPSTRAVSSVDLASSSNARARRRCQSRHATVTGCDTMTQEMMPRTWMTSADTRYRWSFLS